MKLRHGFVSNSSSSSFICDVCGENVSGMDIGLDEAEMCQCEHNHVICQKHRIWNPTHEEITTLYKKEYWDAKDDDSQEKIDEWWDENKKWYFKPTFTEEELKQAALESYIISEGDDLPKDISEDDQDSIERELTIYHLPSRFCPCCQFKYVSQDDFITYILYKLDMTYETIAKEMRKTFKNWNDFHTKTKKE